MKIFILVTLYIFSIFIPGISQTAVDSTYELFESHQYQGISYRLLNPINSNGSYPVIVSLHGAGGRGSDNIKQLKDSKWINYLASEKIRKDYPCYLFVPQSNELWNEEHLSKFKEIISHLPSVDTSRIYLLGHSMVS